MKTKNLVLVIASMTVLLSLYSCSSSNNNQDNKEASSESTAGTSENKSHITQQNLNISIFLDVSDRISPKIHPNQTMEYYQRDIGYINSVASALEHRLLRKKVNLLNDNIQLFIEPTPANREINSIIEQLKHTITKNNATKEGILNLSDKYTMLTTKLYEEALKAERYDGSDIWGFFKNNVKDYCIEENHRNILVVITDGYAYYKPSAIREGNASSYLTENYIKALKLNNSNWKTSMDEKGFGFIVANSGLENLEVLVLGVNTYDGNPYTQDIVKAYWSNWLEAMGVQRYAIKGADIPSSLDGVIQKFILNP
ncbi:MAG: hypothetical protein ACK5L5_09330 [Bacteroidales bacterium]